MDNQTCAKVSRFSYRNLILIMSPPLPRQMQDLLLQLTDAEG
jgi:hypothetical protein